MPWKDDRGLSLQSFVTYQVGSHKHSTANIVEELAVSNIQKTIISVIALKSGVDEILTHVIFPISRTAQEKIAQKTSGVKNSSKCLKLL
jgi:hypothetical protein